MNSQIKVFVGDITCLHVDAIVNAANKNLCGGSGVDGAIHKAAGSKLLDECRKLHGCKIGRAKITSSYNIKNVKAIIHTVGPRVFKKKLSNKKKLELELCYRNCLKLLVKNNLRTIAFPAISTGRYKFPKDYAADIAIGAVKKFLQYDENYKKIDKIIFCLYTEEYESTYKYFLKKYLKNT